MAASLDETEMRKTLAAVCLPGADSWAIVDLIQPNGQLLRLAIPRADVTDHVIAESLNGKWMPREDDPFGYPAVKRAGRTIALVEQVDAALAKTAQDSETLTILRARAPGRRRSSTWRSRT